MEKRRCLIVGGRPSRRRALVRLLQEEGYDVRDVASAAEALRLLPDFVPDAVLGDADQGAELVEVLRTVRARRPGVRVWVMRDHPTDAAGVVELVDGFFDRPANLHELRRALGH